MTSCSEGLVTSTDPSRRGACVWLTGLSGAGKSTTAAALCERLVAAGYAAVLIDGDELRRTAVPPLGFSKADRDANVLRAADLAREAANCDSIAVCALISPYRETRAAARRLVGSHRFVEVFVDTPLGVCEARDPKGLYDRARRLQLPSVSGIDQPYEPPIAPAIVLHTERCTPAENVARLVALLIDRRLLADGIVSPARADA